MFVTFHAIIFEIETLGVEKCWPFRVKIHFAISHRPTRDSILSCDIAGLISKVSEEVATQIADNPTLI